jgi:hypothetical protein
MSPRKPCDFRGLEGLRLPVPVDDPAAVEVVWRQLDADAVAGKDADPESAHLAGGVPEGLVAVVQRDPELAVPERLDDLALELDLLFFFRQRSTPPPE